jgi:hypothetical protein
MFLQNALAATAAPFPGQYSGFEAYPYATTTGNWWMKWIIFISFSNIPFLNQSGAGASATGYMPYGAYATLPQQGAFNGLTNLPYQNAAANASLQEARLQ